jgi:hypothetical protein
LRYCFQGYRFAFLEAKNPGPESDCLRLVSANISSWSSADAWVLARPEEIVCVQEHRLTGDRLAAADAAVDEWRSKGTTRKKGKRESSSSSAATAASAAKIEQRLRSRLTVVIAAWKLQALLGPGVAASGGKAAVGSAGAGVAAELACVGAEMEGF